MSTDVQLRESLQAIRNKIIKHKKPAIIFEQIRSPSFCAFGGTPEYQSEFNWPSDKGVKLDFIAALNLEAIAKKHKFNWLPKTGQLLFFYDTMNQPWGFDPKDKSGHKVIFLNKPINIGKGGSNFPDPIFVKPKKIDSYPNATSFESRFDDLTDEEIDTYLEEEISILPESVNWCNNQTGGFPDAYQNDEMEWEAELASNGIYCGNSEIYSSPETLAMKKKSDQWKLLLQIQENEDIGFEWGDTGTIFFWIKESDAKLCNFDNTWLILQSS